MSTDLVNATLKARNARAAYVGDLAAAVIGRRPRLTNGASIAARRLATSE